MSNYSPYYKPSVKPTRREEWVGRLSVLVLAAFAGGAATLLTIFGVRVFVGVSEGVSHRGGQILIVPIAALIGAAFLYLLAAVLALMAFFPSRDTKAGPPRGFTAVGRLFDGFGAIVGAIMKIFRWV